MYADLGEEMLSYPGDIWRSVTGLEVPPEGADTVGRLWAGFEFNRS